MTTTVAASATTAAPMTVRDVRKRFIVLTPYRIAPKMGDLEFRERAQRPGLSLWFRQRDTALFADSG
ncbi:hypothetical protein ACQPZF_12355 [Actinosynnema sp. CS-041913]|uniref:hypothetical protein n=1 Tax=Actinosynnema sp. CS-041913 TaxID=3239917 RepID=UPI003D94A720